MRIRFRAALTGRLIVAVLFIVSCAGPAPKRPTGASADAEWTTAMKAGRSAFDRGDLELAARFYEAALSRGRTMDAAPAIADSAYNLAACRVAQGEYRSAHALLQEAKAGMARSLGEPEEDVLLLEADVLWRLGEADEALLLTGKLLGSAQNETAKGLRLHARLLRGKIACAKGDAERAMQELALAEKAGGGSTSYAVSAVRSELAGCIELLQGKAAPAARHFDREADLLRKAGQYRRMADALGRAGDAYARAALKEEAADRLFRAARTIFTLGDLPRARDLATRALRAGSETKNETIAEQTRSLLEEIAAEGAGQE